MSQIQNFEECLKDNTEKNKNIKNKTNSVLKSNNILKMSEIRKKYHNKPKKDFVYLKNTQMISKKEKNKSKSKSYNKRKSLNLISKIIKKPTKSLEKKNVQQKNSDLIKIKNRKDIKVKEEELDKKISDLYNNLNSLKRKQREKREKSQKAKSLKPDLREISKSPQKKNTKKISKSPKKSDSKNESFTSKKKMNKNKMNKHSLLLKNILQIAELKDCSELANEQNFRRKQENLKNNKNNENPPHSFLSNKAIENNQINLLKESNQISKNIEEVKKQKTNQKIKQDKKERNLKIKKNKNIANKLKEVTNDQLFKITNVIEKLNDCKEEKNKDIKKKEISYFIEQTKTVFLEYQNKVEKLKNLLTNTSNRSSKSDKKRKLKNPDLIKETLVNNSCSQIEHNINHQKSSLIDNCDFLKKKLSKKKCLIKIMENQKDSKNNNEIHTFNNPDTNPFKNKIEIKEKGKNEEVVLERENKKNKKNDEINLNIRVKKKEREKECDILKDNEKDKEKVSKKKSTSIKNIGVILSNKMEEKKNNIKRKDYFSNQIRTICSKTGEKLRLKKPLKEDSINELKKSKIEEIANEQWSTPKEKILTKNSKELIISNLSKKIDDEFLLDRFKGFNNTPEISRSISYNNTYNNSCERDKLNSQLLAAEDKKNLKNFLCQESKDKIVDIYDYEKEESFSYNLNSDIWDKKNELNKNMKIDQEFNNVICNKKNVLILDVKDKIICKKNSNDQKPPNNKNIEFLTHFVIDKLIEDFFQDPLYKYFFFPEKIKGIQTNQKYVKKYLEKLLAFLESENAERITKNLNKPLKPTLLTKMALLRKNEDLLKKIKNDELMYEPILDVEIYLKLEKKICEEEFNSYEHYQIDLAHIFNKMIFDCLNEVLDKKRIYGIKGESFPQKLLWKNHKLIKKENIELIMKFCLNNILEWNSFLCGFIPDKEDSFHNVFFSLGNEVIKQIKDDRMFRLISHDVNDFDKELIYCEEEEFEVIEFFNTHIFEHLLNDLVFDFLL